MFRLCLCILAFAFTFIPALAEELASIEAPDGEKISFSVAEISDAKARKEEKGSATVLIELTTDGSKKLGDFTSGHVGFKVNFIVCGTLVSQPVIRSPINGRSMQFWTQSESEASDFVEALKRGRCP